MVLPDVNVLVNAFRDDLPAHSASAQWLDSQVNGPSAYGMADRVVEGFIRVATLPNLYKDQVPIDVAVEFAEMLVDQPNCVRVNPGTRQWSLFLDLLASTNAAGNAVSDAWLAALAIESGSEWVTWDKGFARYPGLKWSTPTLSD
jgi:toxin-antitoxin system PIN domain toxin